MFSSKKVCKRRFILLTAVFFVVFSSLFGPASVEGVTNENYEVRSPYENVNWDNYEYLKSSFHSHTMQSDGEASVEESVKGHEEDNFDVLAITNHFVCTYPWEDYGVDSDNVDILAIPGSEPTYDGNLFRLEGSHMPTLFTEAQSAESNWGSGAEPRGWVLSFDEFLDVVGGRETHPETGKSYSGIQFFAHPEWHEQSYEGKDWDWYYRYFDEYDDNHLVGLEVINAGNNYSDYNTNIFDKNLRKFGWDREVYGLAVSDEHKWDWNTTWTTVLAPERTTEAVRDSISEGRMFFVQNLGEGKPPKVSEINIENDEIELEIENRGGYEEIRWIFDGETVKTGNSFYFENIEDNQNYVRFEIWGQGEEDSANLVGSQAFYFGGSDKSLDFPEDEPPQETPWTSVGIVMTMALVVLVVVLYIGLRKDWLD